MIDGIKEAIHNKNKKLAELAKGGIGRIFVQPAKQRQFTFNMTIPKMQTPVGLNMIISFPPESDKSVTSPNWQNRDWITPGGCNRKSGGLFNLRLLIPLTRFPGHIPAFLSRC